MRLVFEFSYGQWLANEAGPNGGITLFATARTFEELVGIVHMRLGKPLVFPMHVDI